MKKKLILAAGAAIAAAAAVCWSKSVMLTASVNELFEANAEALARVEQPDTIMCIYDPDYDCEALHPTDPDKDKIRYYAKWR